MILAAVRSTKAESSNEPAPAGGRVKPRRKPGTRSQTTISPVGRRRTRKIYSTFLSPRKRAPNSMLDPRVAPALHSAPVFDGSLRTFTYPRINKLFSDSASVGCAKMESFRLYRQLPSSQSRTWTSIRRLRHPVRSPRELVRMASMIAFLKPRVSLIRLRARHGSLATCHANVQAFLFRLVSRIPTRPSWDR